MSEAIQGLIIAHSSLAAGLAAATQQISGVTDALQTVSNEGRGPEGLLGAIQDAVGDSPVILFTDLASGSCAFAARKCSLDRPGTGIIYGVNLPILLDFVFHRDMALAELVERLVEKGQSGINGAYSEEGARADRAASR